MSPSPGDNPGRTLPEWLDPQNLHGRMYYLFLRTANGRRLPKNPFLIGKSIENFAGKIEGGYFDKRNLWYVLKIRNKDQARKLTTMTKLDDDTPIEIGRHPTLNTRKFVVRCEEVEDMSEEELVKELSAQKIISVRRITRKTAVGIVGTPTLILTISSTLVPEFVNFGLLKVRTRLYYSQPMICRLCLRYGHPKNRCGNKIACIVCSGPHDSNICPEGTKYYCLNCKGDHSPLDKKCSVYRTEAAAIKISTEQNMTLVESRKLVASNPNLIISYADTLKQKNGNTTSPYTQPASNPAPQPKETKEKEQQQQISTKRNNHHSPAEQNTVRQTETTSPPRKKVSSQASPAVSTNPKEDAQCGSRTVECASTSTAQQFCPLTRSRSSSRTRKVPPNKITPKPTSFPQPKT